MLDTNEKETFVELYQKDMSELSFSEMEENNRIGKLLIGYLNSGANEYPIYDNFERTIAYLEEYGIKMKEPLADCEIQSLEIYNEDMYRVEMQIADADILEEIKEELVLDKFYYDEYIYGIENARMACATINRNGKSDTVDVWVRESTLKQINKN